MLVTSIFSFSKSVFKSLLLQTQDCVVKSSVILDILEIINFVDLNRIILQVGHQLTLDYKLKDFDNSEKETYSKHCEKQRQCSQPTFSPFSTNFYACSKTNFFI